MVQIKFAPISSEREIIGTNCSIQIGVIQNDARSWGVKITQNGKVIAARRIKKLIDVEIVGVIRDTIGKEVALDTFELGGIMSKILREVYDKLKGKQKTAEPQKATPQPVIIQQTSVSQPNNQEQDQPTSVIIDFKMPNTPPLTSGGTDDFWSSYSNLEISKPYVEPNTVPQQLNQAATSTSSGNLDDVLGILGVTCPNCGREVDPDLERCPFCEQKL